MAHINPGFWSKARTVLVLATCLSAYGPAFSGTRPTLQLNDLQKLGGEWIFVEDKTEGRTLEQLNPPMGGKFAFRVEDGAIVLVSGHGGSRREVRVTLDGTVTDVPGQTEGSSARYRGSWKDGALTYEVDFVRAPGKAPEGLIRREFRWSADGLTVRSNLGSPTEYTSVGLYRHAEDIPAPAPAKAAISDLKWLEGDWVGSRSTGSTFEERWSPAKGGAMLAVSRTVNASGKMSAFEYLRIVERNDGLVYVAQPGGAPATEFVLTEFSARHAVFENPRHDYPKRIAYHLSSDGVLSATIGFLKGGTPRQFEFKREGG